MRFYCLFIILVFFKSAYSQPLIFDKIGKKDGLPDNDILCIQQDNYGHLWFGCVSGLSLYNGYSFRVWRHEPGDSTSLPDNTINFITATPHHSILVGTFSTGVFLFDYQKESFLPLDKTQKNPHKKWLSAYYAKSDIIYIGSSDGLEYFDEKTERLIKIDLKIDNPIFISSITEDETGCLWMLCSSNQVVKYDPKTGEREIIVFGNNTKPLGNRGGRLMYQPEGYVWIGTEYEGLYIYNIATKTVEHLGVNNGRLASNMVLSFLLDHSHGVWVGTDNGGLYFFKDAKDKQPIHYNFDVNDENSISSNTVYAMIQIEPSLMLLGTFAGGLNIMNHYRHKFPLYSDKGLPGKVLSQRSVLDIHPAENGNVWLGTDGGGVNLYDPKTNIISHFTKEENRMPNSSVAKSVFVDSKSRIWVGSFGGGVSVFDSKMNHIRNFSVANNANRIESEHVWCIAEDEDHRIWLGTMSNGVERISSDLNKIEHYPFYVAGNSGLRAPRINTIHIDRNKKLWVVSETLHYFDETLNKFVEYSFPGVQLPSNIHDICEDQSGNLWVGGDDAAFYKIPFNRSEKPEIYPASAGWYGNNVISIQNDNNGNIWLATNVGISCMVIKASSNAFLNFDIHDGVQPGQFNISSKYKDQEGFIYFGSTVGFQKFHPDQIILNKHLPKVSISDIRVFNEPLSNILKYKKSRAVFWNDSTIQLNYDEKMISIEFAGLDFVLPEKNKFAYILEGFDKNWNYSHAGIHMATYTNLDPGTYTFKVRAANNDGIWNDKISEMTLVILPPWYKTWWFRTMFLLLLLSVAYGLFFWRTRLIRKKNFELKHEVEAQTYELRHINTQMAGLYSELTESIQAAQIIQKGILPGQTILEQYFGKIDFFYQPKDVVSGDFYWCAKAGSRNFLAVIDCTGHGVAGAFMTFIAYETLNQIIRENSEEDAGKIVSILNQEILSSMNRYQTNEINAGMDVSLCITNSDSNIIQFAGANNPIYIVREDKVIIQKGDRQGIAGKQKSPDYQFETAQIELKLHDQVYLFSDGYADQIGGPDKNQKFMYSRFRDTLVDIRNKNIKDRISSLKHAFEDWRNNTEQLDDVLVIGFEV